MVVYKACACDGIAEVRVGVAVDDVDAQPLCCLTEFAA